VSERGALPSSDLPHTVATSNDNAWDVEDADARARTHFGSRALSTRSSISVSQWTLRPLDSGRRPAGPPARPCACRRRCRLARLCACPRLCLRARPCARLPAAALGRHPSRTMRSRRGGGGRRSHPPRACACGRRSGQRARRRPLRVALGFLAFLCTFCNEGRSVPGPAGRRHAGGARGSGWEPPSHWSLKGVPAWGQARLVTRPKSRATGHDSRPESRGCPIEGQAAGAAQDPAVGPEALCTGTGSVHSCDSPLNHGAVGQFGDGASVPLKDR
jgi:hypothetical protein